MLEAFLQPPSAAAKPSIQVSLPLLIFFSVPFSSFRGRHSKLLPPPVRPKTQSDILFSPYSSQPKGTFPPYPLPPSRRPLFKERPRFLPLSRHRPGVLFFWRGVRSDFFSLPSDPARRTHSSASFPFQRAQRQIFSLQTTIGTVCSFQLLHFPLPTSSWADAFFFPSLHPQISRAVWHCAFPRSPFPGW